MQARVDPGMPPSSISPEVLNVLPEDPELQLNLARQIIHHSLTSKLATVHAEHAIREAELRSALEERASQAGMLTRALDTRVAEAAQLRKALEVAKREAARMHAEMDELRQAGGGFESQLRVAESVMRQSQDSLESLHTERDKLQAEKVALIDTIKSLNRSVARLDATKTSLIKALSSNETASNWGVSTSSPEVIVYRRKILQALQQGDQVSERQELWVDLAGERLVDSVLERAAATSSAVTLKRRSSADVARQQLPSFERGTSQRLSTSSLPFVGRQSLDGNGTDSNGLRKWGSASHQEPNSRGETPLAGALGRSSFFDSRSETDGPGHRRNGSVTSAASRRKLGGSKSFTSGRQSSGKLSSNAFWQHARLRLTNGGYKDLLEAIKKLKAGQTTKDDTVQVARKIFSEGGCEDMFGGFEEIVDKFVPPAAR